MSAPFSPVARELLWLYLAQPDFVGSVRDFSWFLNRSEAEVLAAAVEVAGFGGVAIEGDPAAPALVFRRVDAPSERAIRAALDATGPPKSARRARPAFGYSRELQGRSAAMQAVYALIDRVSHTNATVLVLGESGAGKEVVARTLHDESLRAERPFTVIDCTAIPPALLESELFGHERGSFTSALRTQIGKFEEADEGTVFLDEIGELPLALQAKLLRVLQTREFTRVGGATPITVDVRFIAATNRPLEELVRARQFREDLYYRLNVVTLTLPPLRDRREDIPLLAHRIVVLASQRDGVPVRGLAPEAIARLEAHDWPGNVRELENVLERALLVATGPTIAASDLALAPRASIHPGAPELKTLREAEIEHIQRVLAATGGNESRAARILGVHRDTISRKLRRQRDAGREVS